MNSRYSAPNTLYLLFTLRSNGLTTFNLFIPAALEDAQSSPKGWFRKALCCVIHFNKGITIIYNECLT